MIQEVPIQEINDELVDPVENNSSNATSIQPGGFSPYFMFDQSLVADGKDLKIWLSSKEATEELKKRVTRKLISWMDSITSGEISEKPVRTDSNVVPPPPNSMNFVKLEHHHLFTPFFSTFLKILIRSVFSVILKLGSAKDIRTLFVEVVEKVVVSVYCGGSSGVGVGRK